MCLIMQYLSMKLVLSLLSDAFSDILSTSSFPRRWYFKCF